MTNATAPRLFRAALLLGPLCGAALWATPGILDAYPSPAGATRVALLPPLWRLALLVPAATAAFAASLFWLARAASRRGHPAPHEAAVGALRPLAALGLLLLPYLPWLPDALPILTVLAGPARWLVWFIVIAQTGRSVWRLWLPARTDEPPRGRLVGVLVVAAGLAASTVAAWRLAGTALYPSGDEPHYLIMAQSLWRDGDLRIEDNHARGEYREYFIGEELAPHYLTRGVDREVYSVHPIGLPLMLAPVYAAGGYVAVLAVLIGIATATGAVTWTWMRRLQLPSSASAFAWLAVASSAPFLLHSFAVYPETTAGLAVVSALLLATTGTASLGRWLGVGLAAGWLPWLSTKYAPMAAVVILFAVGRIWIGERHARLRSPLMASAALLVPFVTSLLAWFGFFWIYWGRLSPTAPYGDQPGTSVGYLPAGAPGLAFDQEYGVLPYAPALALAALGLAGMWRAGAGERRLAIEISLTVLALVAAVGAFHIWWGGGSPPGRPVVSGLPLLAVPIAWRYARDRERPLRAAADRLLLLWGLGGAAILVLSQQGFLIDNDRDGTSNLLAHLSPLWPLSNLAPSFIAQPVPVASAVVGIWLLLVALAARWLLQRERRTRRGERPGASGLTATLAAAAVILAASIAVPRAIGPYAAPPVDLRSRAQVGLLDRFDAHRLPTALVFDPARRADPSQLLSRFSFVVEPPSHGADDGGTEPLLYGRRLVLPAGRYRVELTAGEGETDAIEGTLALKLGRRDPPAAQWDVSLTRGGDVWMREFELGIDVGYVGFRASSELDHAQPRIQLHPLAITDASDRTRHTQVVGAYFYPQASVFFLDDNVFAEPAGFWIRRGRSSSFLVTPSGAGRPSSALQLRTHCGPAANHVRITSAGVDDRLEFEPGQAHDVVVSTESDRAFVTMDVADGFVPAETDAASTDRRDLGCWVQVAGWIE